MSGDPDVEEDERTIELSSIAAIFPELVVDPQHPFTASLELPVNPSKLLAVIFPPLTDGAPPAQAPAPPVGQALHIAGHQEPTAPVKTAEIRYLSHLPPLHVKVTLPDGYPAESPPQVHLAAHSSWVPEEKLRGLERRAQELWEELGQDQVVYDYIDSLQQAAEDGLNLVPQGGSALVLPRELELPLLDFDLEAKIETFRQGTFDCGVCLEPKKGAVCYRLQECGHVFCIECLQDFYNNCITEGNIYSVKCLAPDCEKNPPSSSSDQPKKKKDRTLDPSELLQIPIEQDKVQRYIKLKKKKRLEANKNTIYCPRQWCQGPAKTTDQQKNDDEADDEADQKTRDPNANQNTLPPPSKRLAVCEDCSFAFCSVCQAGWHGEFAVCWPRKEYELTQEEKASEAYLNKHSTKCPTCSARCQKTMGCNHMECFQCKTHFCYLCSAWLDKQNPYVHFNTQWHPCYMRLWELEEGDDDNSQRPPNAARPPPPPPPDVIFEDRDEEEPAAVPPPAPNPPRQGNRQQERPQHPGVRVNRRVQQGLARPAPIREVNREHPLW